MLCANTSTVLLGTLLLFTWISASSAESLNNNEFATRLLSLVAAEYRDTNIVFSPIAIHTISSLLFIGARGETANELRRGLRLQGKSIQEIAEDFGNLLNGIDSPIGPTLKIHNKIFADIESVVNPEFAGLALRYFKAGIQKVDFTLQQKSADTINKWITNVTENTIQKIIDTDEIDEVKTTVVIASSIHFNWEWEHPFNPLQTKKLPFFLSTSQSKKVSMLYQKTKFKHGLIPSLEATWIELPYRNSNLSMLILLPKEIDGLPDLEKKLKKFPLENITNEFEYDEVSLKLPKFDFGFVIDMEEPLKELGIRLIFGGVEGVPDLVEMFPQPFNIYISKFLHKAAIEAYEFSTEAYAAPVSGVAFRTATFPFTIDRPFVFLIRTNKVVYYIGHVVDPELY